MAPGCTCRKRRRRSESPPGGRWSPPAPVAAGDEHVTAYYLIECPDRDRAVEIASRVLDSHVTAVEVRQIHNSTGLD